MDEVVIQARENGPLKVTGPFTIVDGEGREYVLPPGTSVVLCRCGHSKNKPFCDTTHKEIGWAPDDTAPRVT